MNTTVITARYTFITLRERLESNPAQEQLAKLPLALWEIGSHWFMPLSVGTFDFLAQAVGLRFRISIQEEAGKGPGEVRGSSGESCVYPSKDCSSRTRQKLLCDSPTCCKNSLDFSIGADRIPSGLRFTSACQGRSTTYSGVFGRLQGLLPRKPPGKPGLLGGASLPSAESTLGHQAEC